MAQLERRQLVDRDRREVVELLLRLAAVFEVGANLKMSKRVRKAKYALKESQTKKQLYAKRSAEARDSGRDSTRMQKLSIEQLCFLNERLGCVQLETHNLHQDYEAYWCHSIAVACTASGYPYVTLVTKPVEEYDYTMPRTDQRFLASHVALAFEGKFAELPTDEASHLCGNHWCVRPSHLAWESHEKNMARVKCKGRYQCFCGRDHDFCMHEPTCKMLRILP